jgi:hypothetical protein
MMPPRPVPYGMIIVSSFELNNNNASGYFTITGGEPFSCPYCDGDLVYRDSRVRGVKNLIGEIRYFLLRRLRCQKQGCNKLHTEIPNIIQPYKHYDSDTIQSVLDGSENAAACVADNSTIRRWETGFAEAEADINQRLASIYAQETDEKVPIASTVHILDRIKIKITRWLTFVMALLINNGYRLRTRFAFCPLSPPDTVRPGSKNEAERGKKGDETIKNSS